MYLECGDCCQQTIISCGNDLARVSNKSPQTDSLTCEIFVPRIQIRGIVLSRNTPAEKCCVLLIHIYNNSLTLFNKDIEIYMDVYNNFVCLVLSLGFDPYRAHYESLGQARGCPRTHQSAAVG